MFYFLTVINGSLCLFTVSLDVGISMLVHSFKQRCLLSAVLLPKFLSFVGRFFGCDCYF